MDVRSESTEGGDMTETADDRPEDASESSGNESDDEAPGEGRRKEKFIGVFIPARV
jgi:hypothetical protein